MRNRTFDNLGDAASRAAVFRDPMESDRVWVIFDGDEQGFKNYLSDPEVPAIIHEAGHVGKPQPAILGGKYGA